MRRATWVRIEEQYSAFTFYRDGLLIGNIENLSDKCRKVSSTCYIILYIYYRPQARFVGFSELRVYLFKKPKVIPSWR